MFVVESEYVFLNQVQNKFLIQFSSVYQSRFLLNVNKKYQISNAVRMSVAFSFIISPGARCARGRRGSEARR